MSQGGEKTEQPTEKRLRDARKKGQVAKSQDLTSALLLVTAAIILALVGAHIGLQLTNAMRDGLLRATTLQGDFNQAAAVGLFWSSMQTMGLVLAPLLIAMFVVALLVSYLQVGPIFSFEPVKPDLKKLNPAEGFKQKFLKPRPYVELVKMIVKMAIAGVVILAVIWDNRADIIRLTSQNVDHAASFTASIVFQIAWKVAAAFVVLGVADRFLQKFLHVKEMKMSKQEVKEEYKETEGNPLFKSARRRIYLEMLQQSMMAAVKKADVVVVNPTHVAVALKYDRSEMEAPIVVAKGAELMAAQIRKIAAEANVPTYRDVPLARALYDIDIDASIPEELYEAVAEVLRWVYQLAEEKKGLASHG
ncbi:MAG TPA: flagellar biosynthesis protein FlhB [Pyrinomonadaceae bacterium]|nr:flagellar biosynthesis protein FlhB [Pyrinomonadaceae bacterium]